jgi:hypothetical protein
LSMKNSRFGFQWPDVAPLGNPSAGSFGYIPR